MVPKLEKIMTDKASGMLNASTWGGAGLAAIGGMTLTQWLAIGGFILALAGFIVNSYFKYKMYQLEKKKLEDKSI